LKINTSGIFKEGKYYVCPDGRRLTFKERKKKKTDSGYPTTADKYECESCIVN
jgi:hypothetical protein